MPAGAWKQDLEKWRGSGGSLLVGELAWAEVGIVSRGQEKHVRGRRLWNFWVPRRRAAWGLRGRVTPVPRLVVLFLGLHSRRPGSPCSFLSHSRGPPVTLTMPHFHFLWAGGEN